MSLPKKFFKSGHDLLCLKGPKVKALNQHENRGIPYFFYSKTFHLLFKKRNSKAFSENLMMHNDISSGSCPNWGFPQPENCKYYRFIVLLFMLL